MAPEDWEKQNVFAHQPRQHNVADLLDFAWHCLRHSFASRLVMDRVSLRNIQELMGQAHPQPFSSPQTDCKDTVHPKVKSYRSRPAHHGGVVMPEGCCVWCSLSQSRRSMISCTKAKKSWRMSLSVGLATVDISGEEYGFPASGAGLPCAASRRRVAMCRAQLAGCVGTRKESGGRGATCFLEPHCNGCLCYRGSGHAQGAEIWWIFRRELRAD